MPEHDPLDARLAAAVHSLAEHARTDVDAYATARTVIEGSGRRRAGWPGVPLPVPAAIVIVAGLLVAGAAWIVGGTIRPDQGTVVAPVDNPTSVPTPSMTPPPTPGTLATL